MFQIPEEHRMLQELVAKFVDNELMPLEQRCCSGRCRAAGRI